MYGACGFVHRPATALADDADAVAAAAHMQLHVTLTA